ncbi:MAG: hypothetical protein ACYCYP_13380 [Leptospirales bacterium]
MNLPALKKLKEILNSMSRSASKVEFFDYYERRLQNIKALQILTSDSPISHEEVSLRALSIKIERKVPDHSSGSLFPRTSFDPEASVLVGAYLDSLAKYWAQAKGKSYNGKTRNRMGDFLSSHGDPEIWTKVNPTHLLLRARSDSKINPALLKGLESEYPSKIHLPITSIDIPKRNRKEWSGDPSLDELLCKLDRHGWNRDQIALSRYGEILYELFRNSWIHGLDPGSQLEPTWFYRGAPQYEYFRGELKFLIPLAFLVETFERALNSFKNEVPGDYRFLLD